MARIILTPKSQRQLDEIAEYIGNNSEYYSQKTIARIFKAIDRLVQFPEIGALIPEPNKKKLREIHIYNYRIIYHYKKRKKEIHIVAVIHGMRLLDKNEIGEI